jgi:hypothetical protein
MPTTDIDETTISNMAISHLGIGKAIQNLETDQNSAEASICRVFYNVARDTVLRDFNWPFARKYKRLNLLETNPSSEWSYAYQYPSDCLKIRKILSGQRVDNNDTQIEYEVATNGDAKLILTDQAEAELEYTVKAVNPLLYPPDMLLALSLYLGSLIAPKLTGGDQFRIGERVLGRYKMEIDKARTNATYESRRTKPQMSDLERARS